MRAYPLRRKASFCKIGEYFLYNGKIYIRIKPVLRKEKRGYNQEYYFAYYVRSVDTGKLKDIDMSAIVDIFEPINLFNYKYAKFAVGNYVPVFERIEQ